MFTDGTQRQHNRNRRSNFSGHKRFYCYGYLVTTAPDGLIIDVAGAFAGRKNDHMVRLLSSPPPLDPIFLLFLFSPLKKQNESNISGHLMAAQQGNRRHFNSSMDKGFHTQPCCNTMYSNLVNTPAQHFSNDLWTTMRVSNENCLALVVNNWKYIDYRKVANLHRQPLGLYYKLACILTNCISCLDHNEVSVYFNCPPPTLEQYLV